MNTYIDYKIKLLESNILFLNQEIIRLNQMLLEEPDEEKIQKINDNLNTYNAKKQALQQAIDQLQ